MKYLSEFHYMDKKTKSLAQLLGQLVVEAGSDSVFAYIQIHISFGYFMCLAIHRRNLKDIPIRRQENRWRIFPVILDLQD